VEIEALSLRLSSRFADRLGAAAGSGLEAGAARCDGATAPREGDAEREEPMARLDGDSAREGAYAPLNEVPEREEPMARLDGDSAREEATTRLDDSARAIPYARLDEDSVRAGTTVRPEEASTRVGSTTRPDAVSSGRLAAGDDAVRTSLADGSGADRRVGICVVRAGRCAVAGSSPVAACCRLAGAAGAVTAGRCPTDSGARTSGRRPTGSRVVARSVRWALRGSAGRAAAPGRASATGRSTASPERRATGASPVSGAAACQRRGTWPSRRSGGAIR
jgi:hypothetical protein